MSYYRPWEQPIEKQEAPKITATYQANGLEERVVVPALKGLIVAVPTGLLVGLLIGAFDVEISAWWTMPIVMLATFLATFLASSSRGQWLVERISGADLNGDGVIGQPLPLLPEPQTVRVEISEDQGRHVEFIDLPARPEQLKSLATGLQQGRTFALTAWSNQFTRPEFEMLRDEMVRRGLARWKNDKHHQLGADLTPAGRAVFKRLTSAALPAED